MTGLVRTSRAMRSTSSWAAAGLDAKGVFEGEEEVLSLADIGDPVQAHAAEALRRRSGPGHRGRCAST